MELKDEDLFGLSGIGLKIELSRSLCAIFKAAYDVMAKEHHATQSFP